MKLSIGIVGLPNVGKSTLFNALLKKQVANVANYPFCTIEPNVGIVEVPDERLPVLAKIVAKNPSTSFRTVEIPPIVPAVVEFYDIAGLVKGASKGEGLGNKFLSHIHEVAAIVHVVRLFEDSEVIHVGNKVDPLSNIQTIESELIFADLETLTKQKEPRPTDPKALHTTYEVVRRLIQSLNQGTSARNIDLSDEEKELIKPLNLLTIKPVIYLFNVSESQLENNEETETQINVILGSEATPESNNDSGQAGMTKTSYLFLNAKLENDILALNENEQKEYLNQYHLSDTGLNRLIKKSYETLGLISFLTAGTLETRAWTLRRGDTALRASSVIHTDFAKHFIKADIVSFENFVKIGGWEKAREAGLVQIVGRDYEMKDGDVVEFKVGV